MKKKLCAGCRKKSCDGCRLFGEIKINTAKEGGQYLPAGFLAKKQSGLGIAFDIGTTTIAASLWDLEQGCWLAGESCMNPQRSYGSDVISRITYCMEHTDGISKLQYQVINAMEKLTEQLLDGGFSSEAGKESGGQNMKIAKATVAGNTVMCQIFLGIPLEGLAKAPFKKGYQEAAVRKGTDMGFSLLGSAEITVLPAIEGYVGADALAVYAYVTAFDKRKNILLVDVGTNGEIVLIGEDRIYACSAPAGPALEGAASVQGMVAAPGAVCRVRMAGSFPREDVFCDVIGDGVPAGICGSGLLDALALMLRQGVIDESGYMRNEREAALAGVKERICRRIQTYEGKRSFLLTEEDAPVHITASDVRELQLAKSAIRAGIEMLLCKAGIKAEELNCLYMAGAFGNYIRTESALAVGLLPDIAEKKVVTVGNGAGVGASMALLLPSIAEEMKSVADKICHVDLASECDFQEKFMAYLAF